jgi:uncharacterized RDD family membrane protein YckC
MSSFEQRSFSGEHPVGRADTHYIDTPEQVELEYTVAGVGSRFVAVLLDMLMIGAFFVVEVVVLVVIGAASLASPAAGKLGEAAGKWLVAFMIFINFAIFWGYFALFEAYWHGQTPGKRAMKLRVIKDSGRQITLFEALARNLLRVVDWMPSLYLVGVITMLCTKRNQRLGDLAAGTMVVHERLDEPSLLYQTSTTRVAPVGFTARRDNIGAQPLGQEAVAPWGQPVTAMFPADAVARLNAQDLVVIEMFFARMLDLPMETRAAVAYRMVAQMAAKMGVGVPEGNPERALESIAYQMRSGGRVN